ncbi:MAG: cache domain-containing protein, partial [Sulfuricellaceae bacterium]
MNIESLFSRRKIWSLVVLVVISCFAAAVALNLKHGYDESLAGATANSKTLALVLEQHAAATIQKADLVVDHVVDEFSRLGDKKPDIDKINRYLADLLHALPELDALRIIKADGHILADGSGKVPATYLGDRPYFIHHRDDPSLGLSLSEPMQGRINPGWNIVFSRRINHPDGSFAGVAVANIGLDYFEKFYGSLDLGKNSSLTLLNDKRTLLARFPIIENLRGKPYPSSLFETRLQQGSSANTYTTELEIDGVERIVSYRKVDKQPLFVIVGVAKTDAFAAWRRNALIDGSVLAVLIVIVTFLSFAMLRRLECGRETAKQLRSTSFHSRNLIEASLDPLVTISPTGKITDVNQATEQITGMPRAYLIGSDFSDYFTEPVKAREAYRKAFADGFVRDYPLAIRHAAGHVADVVYNATVYRDEAGVVQGVFAAARDVTEHHRSERILEFENHALAIISGNPPLSAILEILCRGIEDILEGTLCSILLLDEDGVHLRLGAAPSLPDEYNRALDGMVLGPAIGSCAAAAFTGRQTIVSDIAHDLLWEDFKEIALHHDLHSCWSMPVYSASGDVLGTFAVYRQIPYMPTPFDLQVTSRASHLASIAIQRNRAAQELKRFNETLELRVTEEVSKNMEQERLLIQQSRLAAMGEMIGNIAHQWRQPLNALGLLLQNTKDAYEFNELDSTYLQSTTETGMRLIAKMSSTIDDFRNFFKPNKEKTSFSLKQSVEDTLSILSASFKNHDIAVELDAADDIIAYGFPNEYSQVLLNILTNAKDAIQANKITHGKIHIHIARHDNLASVSVRDNAG